LTALRIKIALAKVAGRLSRLSRRGGGTSLPGKVLLRLEPKAVSLLAHQLPRGSVIVSATNGKTTTANMIAGVLRHAGISSAHNRTGANMPGGVATALLDRTKGGRLVDGGLGLFEVDEAWVETLVGELEPHTVVLGNLFRDQLDRYGELERLADDWARLISERPGGTTYVLNADDPLVADLGTDEAGGQRPDVVFFGIEDRSHALEELEHAFDAKHCRRCGTPYRYSHAYLGHLGAYRCPACGNARPKPVVAAERIALDGMAGSRIWLTTPAGPIELSLPIPGLYNVYNALAATACCLSIGLGVEDVRLGLESFAASFGRAERVEIGPRALSILLIKNPAGANEVFRTLSATTASAQSGEGELDLLIALNDGIADGRDISWIWDADFEILAPNAHRVVCSGTRAPELALRLKYAGLPPDRLEVIGSLERALDHSLAGNGTGPLYALPTYTALLELRDLLADRGHARPYWEAP
jgi:lipid II isoglutaminyl synthase (glutamine-hydrolysing)